MTRAGDFEQHLAKAVGVPQEMFREREACAERSPQERNDNSCDSEEDFADLMAALRAGSEEAAWKIVDLYTPHVMRVVRASLPHEIRSKVDSIDLANTLFGSLLLKKHRLAGVQEPAQLLALLTKVARNRVIDEHRKYTVCAARDIRAEDGLYDDRELAKNGEGGGVAGDGRLGGREVTPSQTAVAREKWRRVLETLDRRDREVVSLRIDGLTYNQIAEQVPDVSERTARRIISAVVERIME